MLVENCRSSDCQKHIHPTWKMCECANVQSQSKQQTFPSKAGPDFVSKKCCQRPCDWDSASPSIPSPSRSHSLKGWIVLKQSIYNNLVLLCLDCGLSVWMWSPRVSPQRGFSPLQSAVTQGSMHNALHSSSHWEKAAVVTQSCKMGHIESGFTSKSRPEEIGVAVVSAIRLDDFLPAWPGTRCWFGAHHHTIMRPIAYKTQCMCRCMCVCTCVSVFLSLKIEGNMMRGHVQEWKEVLSIPLKFEKMISGVGVSVTELVSTIWLSSFDVRQDRTVEPISAVKTSISTSGLHRLEAVDLSKELHVAFTVPLCLKILL